MGDGGGVQTFRLQEMIGKLKTFIINASCKIFLHPWRNLSPRHLWQFFNWIVWVCTHVTIQKLIIFEFWFHPLFRAQRMLQFPLCLQISKNKFIWTIFKILTAEWVSLKSSSQLQCSLVFVHYKSGKKAPLIREDWRKARVVYELKTFPC